MAESTGTSISIQCEKGRVYFFDRDEQVVIRKKNKAIPFLLLLILAIPTLCLGQEKVVAVLISREITPYVAMVEGLEARLNAPLQRFFLDEAGRPYSLGGRSSSLNLQAYGVLVAVGPEALRYLHARAGATPLVFGMVLNPRKVINDPQEMVCGVSLNIPAEAQFDSILRQLPRLRRLGVLYDPANNQAWFTAAAAVAAARGFELVPLPVRRQEGKLAMASDFSRLDAILFIPDASIISKPVIQYVIKQGVVQNTPVIGYNQFFHDSGAAFTLLIDYRAVGQQVARQVERLLVGEKCEGVVSPLYELAINEEVWRKLKK